MELERWPITVLNQDGATTRKGKLVPTQKLRVLADRLRLEPHQYLCKSGETTALDLETTALEAPRSDTNENTDTPE